MGFVGESFVNIGVDKGLAFLEGGIKLADSKFVLSRADVLLEVFLGRCGYLVNQMNRKE